MNKMINRITVPIVFLLVGIFLFTPLFRMVSRADVLGEGFLFLERMQADVATEMTVMFTPSTTLNEEDNIREFRIIFPGVGAGVWCLADNAELTITGVSASPVEQGSWTINAALPHHDEGTVDLEARCHQGGAGGNDYIEVVNIGSLTSGISYGFTLDADVSVFKTGSAGEHLISYQLEEGEVVENLTFGINLLPTDQVIVTTEVLPVDTISCTVGGNVELPDLFPGGPYVTGNHTLFTDATTGFYWTVYGVGNGTNEAGLYKSTAEQDLLSSHGSNGVVNLITGDGFGLEFSSVTAGTPEDDYNPTANGGTGIFGEFFLQDNYDNE